MKKTFKGRKNPTIAKFMVAQAKEYADEFEAFLVRHPVEDAEELGQLEADFDATLAWFTRCLEEISTPAGSKK